MPEERWEASRLYAIAQTVLLVLFAAAFVSDAGPLLLPPGGVPGAVGMVLSVAGLALLLAALPALGRAIQIAPRPRADAHLVTSGVYRFFRHPIYTAIVVLVVGLFLRKPTLPVAAAAAVVIAYLAVKVRFEERLLLARYPEYAEYRTKAWGLVPWPRRRRPAR